MTWDEIVSEEGQEYFYDCRQIGDVYYMRIENGDETEKLISYQDGTSSTTFKNMTWQRDWRNPIVGISYPDMPATASFIFGYLPSTSKEEADTDDV